MKSNYPEQNIAAIRTLEEAVSINKNKILNPDAQSLSGQITRNQPALIVLAAGKGTRFGSSPKCIQPVRGIPLSRHSIDSFRRIHDSPVICLVGYRHEEVRKHLGDDLIFVLSDNPVGGTAQAVWEAFCVDELTESDPLVIITMGDRIVPTSIFERLLTTHYEGGSEGGLTFLTARYEAPNNKGRGRILRESQGRVKGIIEQRDIDQEKNAVLRTALDNLVECNCPLYLVRASLLKKALGGITNNNAQLQFYLTDIISVMYQAGLDIRTVTVTPDDPEFDLLSSDVTRTEDLALLEGIILSGSGQSVLKESPSIRAASEIAQGRSPGQILSIARQLEKLYGHLLKNGSGFRANEPLAVGISGGRLRIAFMHPDMERFYGPAWQMPIGAANEEGDEQIIVLAQQTTDHQISIYPENPEYQEKINSIPADNELFYPSDQISDVTAYEAFGSRLSENLLFSLGYFSDDEIMQRKLKGIPLPPSSLWISSNMRRPFTLIGNAIASIRTLRHGSLGAKVQKLFGKEVFRGLCFATTGSIPQGGFSSSSAVTVATKNAINALFELGIPPDLLIHLASQAEYGTGVRAGSLDQATEQKGKLGEGTLISSNPRDNYRILGTYQVPTDRYTILFPYSVERDREAWKWSWGFYGPDKTHNVLTAEEFRKLTGKAAAIAAILVDLPGHTDFFKVMEQDLLEDGKPSLTTRKWISKMLIKLPLLCDKDTLQQMVEKKTGTHIPFNIPENMGHEAPDKKTLDKSVEYLFTGWRNPVIPASVTDGKVSFSEGVPLRAIVTYLFAEVIRNFYMIHHPGEWIRCVTQSQRGDCCFSIKQENLPSRQEMEQELPWEENLGGPERMEAWLKRYVSSAFDYNEGIRDVDLRDDLPVDFYRIQGGSFFRGLALIDLTEAMLKRAFGDHAVAVRVNAAGQGDYFQVHIDRKYADSEQVKSFINRAFYQRFGLQPARPFVELHSGSGASGTRINRADMLPSIIHHLRKKNGEPKQ